MQSYSVRQSFSTLGGVLDKVLKRKIGGMPRGVLGAERMGAYLSWPPKPLGMIFGNALCDSSNVCFNTSPRDSWVTLSSAGLPGASLSHATLSVLGGTIAYATDSKRIYWGEVLFANGWLSQKRTCWAVPINRNSPVQVIQPASPVGLLSVVEGGRHVRYHMSLLRSSSALLKMAV